MTLGKFRSGKELGWSALASWKHEVGHKVDHTVVRFHCFVIHHPDENFSGDNLRQVKHYPSCQVGRQAVHASCHGQDTACWMLQVFFGWNLAATAPGTVAVGDDIIVTRKRTTALAA